MGCASCGGGGYKQVTQIYNGQVEQTMVEWFQSLGWMYVGLCGCRENHKVFQHQEIKGWEVWVHQMGNTVQFRKVSSAADKVKKGMAGLGNYKEGYQYWVIDYDKKFKITE